MELAMKLRAILPTLTILHRFRVRVVVILQIHTVRQIHTTQTEINQVTIRILSQSRLIRKALTKAINFQMAVRHLMLALEKEFTVAMRL